MVKAQSHSSKNSVNRGAWTAEEDRRLFEYVRIHGDKKWRSLPARAGLNRCGKSCRLRWLNYLRPDIKRGNISEEEEDLIMRLHNLLGNRWSLIAGRLPGRTDNEIKNYWNTHLSKKCLSMGELNLKINKVKRSQKPLPVPIIITCALSSNPEATGEKFGLESQHPPYWSDLSEKDLETDLDINIDRFFDFTGAISSTEAEQGPCSSDLGDHQKPVHEENARNFSELLDCEQIPEMDFCHDPSNFDQIDLEMLSRFLESDMDSGHQPNAGVLSLAL